MTPSIVTRVLLAAALACVSPIVAQATNEPVAVSPGGASKMVMAEGPCPTFSWGDFEGAEDYELVAYRLGKDGEEAEAALRQEVPGSANSWTPPLDRCLERGGRYAWSIRASGPNGGSDWSTPRMFEVASGPIRAELEAALAVVREYLGQDLSNGQEELVAEEPTGGDSASPRSKPREKSGGNPLPGSVAVGDPDIQVNGAAVVTTATLGPGVAAQLCLAVDYRYVDLGDGTVLDCKTQLQWLKDGACLGDGDWDDSGAPGSVQGKVIDLNDSTIGSDFECTGYTDGAYTDWRVPEAAEMCGAWVSGCTGDCCTSEDGLIDSTFFGPAVLNAAGDGQWEPEDAFVLLNIFYWSATSRTPLQAYNLNFASGDVSFADKTNAYFVLPVREAQ